MKKEVNNSNANMNPDGVVAIPYINPMSGQFPIIRLANLPDSLI